MGFTPENMVHCLGLRLTLLDAQITLSERFLLGRKQGLWEEVNTKELPVVFSQS